MQINRKGWLIMTQTDEKVLSEYQVRKTKKQRGAFIDYVSRYADSLGYKIGTEKGSFGANNIIVGDPETAKVVYTAHYDTCARLPFPNFITPKNIGIYLLYQLAITVVFMFLPMFIIGFVCGYTFDDIELGAMVTVLLSYAWLIAFMYILIAGPANKNTANDNTSGVAVLLNIMAQVKNEDREKVAFIFFDLEEAGLLGSSAFAKKHKAAMKNKLLINFDCVSDGDNILFVLKKGAKEYEELLKNAYPCEDGFNVEVLSKGVFYPSDQAQFPCGVGVAALKKSKKRNILYMDKIHTKNDVVFDEKNIEYLTAKSVGLVERL